MPNPHRIVEVFRRLQRPSGWLLHEFKEILVAVTYLAALLALCWFLHEIGYLHISLPGVTGVQTPLTVQ